MPLVQVTSVIGGIPPKLPSRFTPPAETGPDA